MNFLNCDVPAFQALVRREYLFDLRAHHGETEPCVVFGVASVPGQATGWHIMLSCGAVFWRLPISAIVHEPDAPAMPLDHLQLWDSFSAQVSAHEFNWLAGLRCRTILKDRKWYDGEYLFTLDWTGSWLADSAGDIGHKCGHVLALDVGTYCIQPNNRIQFFEPSFVTKPFPAQPPWLTNSTDWKAERATKWATSDDDRYCYDTTRD